MLNLIFLPYRIPPIDEFYDQISNSIVKYSMSDNSLVVSEPAIINALS